MNRELLREFKDESNPYKFEPECELKLSTGMNMGYFFRLNRNSITNSNDLICVDIMCQFDKYLAYKKVVHNGKYERHLKEYSEVKDIKKYERGFNGKFSDGESMCYFFDKYKEKILNSDDEYSKAIKISYRTYLTLCRIDQIKTNQIIANMEKRNGLYNSPLFKKRLTTFKELSSFDKFSQKKKMYLDDKIAAFSFWNCNKKYILNSEDEICKEIKEQYEEYKRQCELSKSNKIFQFKYLSFEKFVPLSDVMFKDGTNAYDWWNKYNFSIKNGTDELCNIIIAQYEAYLNMTDGMTRKEIYEDNAIEKLNNMYLKDISK